MGTLQNITAEGLLSILGISGYNGIAVAKSQATATTLVITVTQPAYAMLGDGIILTSELVSTTVEDLSTDGDYRLYLDYEDVYEGRDVVWTVATSAPSPAALLIAAVTVAGNTISAVTLLRSTPLPSTLTQPVAFTPPPPLSEWTWLNQGPYDNPTDWPLLVTADDIPGGIRFTAPGPTSWPAIILANNPLPDPPYTITTAFRGGVLSKGLEVKIILRNSSTDDGAAAGIFVTDTTSWLSDTYRILATTTSFSSSHPNSGGDFPVLDSVFWLRIQNDGSEIHLFASRDGLSFVETFSVDSNALGDLDLGAMDQYGIGIYNSFAAYSGPPFLELYNTWLFEGRVIIDLLSIEVVPELAITTAFV